MRSNTARIALAVGGIAVIVVLFAVLNGGNSNNNDKSSSTTTPASGTTAKPRPPTVIEVRAGKPVGGVQRLTYAKGDQVRFRVNSDVADEIHVHGYDFHKDVPAGGSVVFAFPAKIDGLFVVELEGRKQQIAELRVNPS